MCTHMRWWARVIGEAVGEGKRAGEHTCAHRHNGLRVCVCSRTRAVVGGWWEGGRACSRTRAVVRVMGGVGKQSACACTLTRPCGHGGGEDGRVGERACARVLLLGWEGVVGRHAHWTGGCSGHCAHWDGQGRGAIWTGRHAVGIAPMACPWLLG